MSEGNRVEEMLEGEFNLLGRILLGDEDSQNIAEYLQRELIPGPRELKRLYELVATPGYTNTGNMLKPCSPHMEMMVNQTDKMDDRMGSCAGVDHGEFVKFIKEASGVPQLYCNINV